MKSKHIHDVVCFGEILWDILPSAAVPGGAPMNVAYHLHKQKKNPALITSVGNDGKGKELIHIFSKFGICTNYFQIDSVHETGKVYAKPDEHNEVVYDIVMPVAWDFIKWNEEIHDLVSRSEYFVYGSLAARNEVSKKTLFQLLEVAKNRVLDINLRTPHFNRRVVEELISKCDFLKINIAELELIAGWYSHFNSLEGKVKSIAEKFKLRNLVVTKGADGASLFIDGKAYHHNGFKVNVKDTVGSGDAFLAGLISKLSANAPPLDSLKYASVLGSFMATQTGACPYYDVTLVEDLIHDD